MVLVSFKQQRGKRHATFDFIYKRKSKRYGLGYQDVKEEEEEEELEEEEDEESKEEQLCDY